MSSQEKIVSILLERYKKNGWSLIRTRKYRPFSYIGYMLTIYDKGDDVSPILDIKAKTIKGIQKKLKEIKRTL